MSDTIIGLLRYYAGIAQNDSVRVKPELLRQAADLIPASGEKPTAWAATGNPIRDPLLTGSEFVADMWRKSGLTVKPLYTRES